VKGFVFHSSVRTLHKKRNDGKLCIFTAHVKLKAFEIIFAIAWSKCVHRAANVTGQFFYNRKVCFQQTLAFNEIFFSWKKQLPLHTYVGM
jgi:hypothetical protein